MIETGLVQLIQGTPAVNSIAPVGGFMAQLPKDLITAGGPPSWTYAFGGGNTEHTLLGLLGPRQCHLLIECYGAPDQGGADAVSLSEAINGVLDGFSGPLPDPSPPTSGILSCLLEEEPKDYFDDAGRTYRRMFEYLICF